MTAWEVTVKGLPLPFLPRPSCGRGSGCGSEHPSFSIGADRGFTPPKGDGSNKGIKDGGVEGGEEKREGEERRRGHRRGETEKLAIDKKKHVYFPDQLVSYT